MCNKLLFLIIFLLFQTVILFSQDKAIVYYRSDIDISNNLKDKVNIFLSSKNISVFDYVLLEKEIKKQENSGKNTVISSVLSDIAEKNSVNILITIEVWEKYKNIFEIKANYNIIRNYKEKNAKLIFFNTTDNLNNSEEFQKAMIDLLNRMLLSKTEDNLMKIYKDEDNYNKVNIFSVGLSVLGEGGFTGLFFSVKLGDLYFFNFGGGFPSYPFFSLSLVNRKNEDYFESLIGITNNYLADNKYIPYVGLGYRFMSQEKEFGLFLRIMGYVAYKKIYDSDVLPWVGFDLGYSF